MMFNNAQRRILTRYAAATSGGDPVAEVRSMIDSLEKLSAPAELVAGLRQWLGEIDKGGQSLEARSNTFLDKVNALRGSNERERRRARLGLAIDGSPIRRVGNKLELGALTREQAASHRARRGLGR